MRVQAANDQIIAGHTQVAQGREVLVALEARAQRDGLGPEFAALVAPPAAAPPQRTEPQQRVKVLESFSAEWLRLPVYAAAGEVLDIPAKLAKTLRRGGIVVFVDSATPLCLREVQWR